MATLSKERKFIAPAMKAPLALDLVRHYCMPDARFPVGRIASIYYDSPRLLAYRDKIEGDNLKKKVRVRWYAQPDQATSSDRVAAFIECKHRLGSCRFKHRTSLTLDYSTLDRAPLDDPFFATLPSQVRDWNDDVLPLDLLPVVCIRYERRRFYCPRTDTRVALDTAIHVDRVNRNLVPNANVPAIDLVVCEFKDAGQHDLPWVHTLCKAGFRLKSFSKYGTSVERLLNGGL